MAQLDLSQLTPEEITELGKTLQRARCACRVVMRVNWANATVIETYRQVIVDLINVDPVFSQDVIVPPFPPKPHLLAKDQWQV